MHLRLNLTARQNRQFTKELQALHRTRTKIQQLARWVEVYALHLEECREALTEITGEDPGKILSIFATQRDGHITDVYLNELPPSAGYTLPRDAAIGPDHPLWPSDGSEPGPDHVLYEAWSRHKAQMEHARESILSAASNPEG